MTDHLRGAVFTHLLIYREFLGLTRVQCRLNVVLVTCAVPAGSSLNDKPVRASIKNDIKHSLFAHPDTSYPLPAIRTDNVLRNRRPKSETAMALFLTPLCHPFLIGKLLLKIKLLNAPSKQALKELLKDCLMRLNFQRASQG